MSGARLTQAARRICPIGAGNNVAISGTSTTAKDVSAAAGGWISVHVTSKTHIRFGTSAVDAAVTTDWPIEAGGVDHFFIPSDGSGSYFRAIRASADGTLIWVLSSVI